MHAAGGPRHYTLAIIIKVERHRLCHYQCITDLRHSSTHSSSSSRIRSNSSSSTDDRSVVCELRTAAAVCVCVCVITYCNTVKLVALLLRHWLLLSKRSKCLCIGALTAV